MVVTNDNYFRIKGLYTIHQNKPKVKISKRGTVKDFSDASRRRLKMKILDQTFNSDNCKFVTLTLPSNPDDFTKMLKRFNYHITKLGISILYKIEYQKSGVIHLHGFVYGESLSSRFWYIAKSIERFWEYSASYDGIVGLVGVSCRLESIRKKNGCAKYVAMYASKDIDVPDYHRGRFWGCLNRNIFETYTLPKRYYMERRLSLRVFRAVANHKKDLTSLSGVYMWLMSQQLTDSVVDILNYSITWDNMFPGVLD